MKPEEEEGGGEEREGSAWTLNVGLLFGLQRERKKGRRGRIEGQKSDSKKFFSKKGRE